MELLFAWVCKVNGQISAEVLLLGSGPEEMVRSVYLAMWILFLFSISVRKR